MADFTQEGRPLAIETPLGKDVLLLVSFTGREEMSRLFHFELELISEQEPIAAKDIVGKNVSFLVTRQNGEQRYFNGFVSRFAYCGKNDRLSLYRAEVVPWLWFLTRTSDCRIFQTKTVPQIIEQIFKDLGFSGYDISGIRGSHPQREYCVQYRETDFAFVSRLMEEEGIFYFFRHENGKHTLVLADQKLAYKDCEDKEVELASPQGALQLTDLVKTWEHAYEFRPGKWTHTDYNFETPSANMMANRTTLVKLDNNSKFEVYDYPGEYTKKSDGEALVKLRMEEEEAVYDLVHGTSICRTFSPGGKFKMVRHFSSAEEGKAYALVMVEHTASMAGAYVSGTDSSRIDYQNSFVCIPDSVTFRPARTTTRPIVHGAQTAVVVGPSGEEIYSDKYGRVKVQFYWDREGQKNEKSSCWIRVSQLWAGQQWGAMYIPRIGQEVVVDFLEGDPDKPLITGRVYNAEQMPPYPLPANQTISTIKSNSSKGGDGFNEIRFEDKTGGEQIFVHAERNMDMRVKNDCMERVIGHRHSIVGWEKDGQKGGDLREMIYQDAHLDVKRDQIEHVEGNIQLLVGKGEAADGGNYDLVIEKKKTETVEQDNDVHVKCNRNEKIDGGQSLTVGGNQQEKVGQNHALDAGQEIHLKAGMKVIIEAGVQLTIKGPGGFVDIGPSGVTIQGIMVLINSGGAAGAGSGSSPTAPTDAKEANPTKPNIADNAQTGQKSSPS